MQRSERGTGRTDAVGRAGGLEHFLRFEGDERVQRLPGFAPCEERGRVILGGELAAPDLRHGVSGAQLQHVGSGLRRSAARDAVPARDGACRCGADGRGDKLTTRHPLH